MVVYVREVFVRFPDTVFVCFPFFLYILNKTLFCLWKALLTISNLPHKRRPRNNYHEHDTGKNSKRWETRGHGGLRLIFTSKVWSAWPLHLLHEVGGITVWLQPDPLPAPFWRLPSGEVPPDEHVPSRWGKTIPLHLPRGSSLRLGEQHREPPIAKTAEPTSPSPQFSDYKSGSEPSVFEPRSRNAGIPSCLRWISPGKALPQACRGKRMCSFAKTRATNKRAVLVTVKLIRNENAQSSRKEGELQGQHSKRRISEGAGGAGGVCIRRQGGNRDFWTGSSPHPPLNREGFPPFLTGIWV